MGVRDAIRMLARVADFTAARGVVTRGTAELAEGGLPGSSTGRPSRSRSWRVTGTLPRG